MTHCNAPHALLLALSLALASTGCSDPGDDLPSETATEGETGDSGSDETGTPADAATVVRGSITDPSGAPLADVEVHSGEFTAHSDANGRFELPVEAGDAVIVHLDKSGYVPGLERLRVLEDTPTALRAVMLPMAPAMPLDSDVGGVVTGERGALIDAPAGAFVTRDGQPVEGMVQVHLTPLNPAVPAEYDAYPGDGLARTMDGSLVQLETFGVLDVTVRQGDVDLTIADGMGVEVEIPLPDPLPAVVPETMALWGFDEEAGVWEEEGLMTLDEEAGTYRGTITHLSPWNADQPMSATCVSGHVEDEEGRPVPGAIVYAEGVDYLGGSTATTDDQGEFCVAVRKDSRVEVTVYDWGNGSAVREIASGSDDTDVPPLCSDPRCEDHGVWTIVEGEGPAPWDPASCTPPQDEPMHLRTALVGDFSVDLDVTRADGLEVCGWVIDDPAAAQDEPSGVTMLSFFEPSGWQVFLSVQQGGDAEAQANGWISVQHRDEPGLSGASLCSIDVSRREEIADDVWGVTGMGECEGWAPGAPEGSLSGSIDFSGMGGEFGGLFPTLCCDLSGVPTPGM